MRRALWLGAFSFFFGGFPFLFAPTGGINKIASINRFAAPLPRPLCQCPISISGNSRSPHAHAAYPTAAEWLRLPSVTQSTGISTSPRPFSHIAPPTFRNEFVCLRFCAKDLPKRFFGQTEIFASPFGRFYRYPALYAPPLALPHSIQL